MQPLPTFDEALRKQREAFADRYQASDELQQYVDGLFSHKEEPSDD